MNKYGMTAALALLSGLALADNDAGIAAYNNANYSTALVEFREASAQGEPFGHHLLASLYYQGHGVEKDLAKAAQLFERAAGSGYMPSHANLGLMYQAGDGVSVNPKKPLFHYREAAAAGDFQSSFNLGQIYRKGWQDVPRSFEKAATYYRFGAQYGHPPSANEYALLYAQGQGVDINFVESYAWMKLAADSGDAAAGKNLNQLKSILKGRNKLTEAEARAAAVAASVAKNNSALR